MQGAWKVDDSLCASGVGFPPLRCSLLEKTLKSLEKTLNVVLLRPLPNRPDILRTQI